MILLKNQNFKNDIKIFNFYTVFDIFRLISDFTLELYTNNIAISQFKKNHSRNVLFIFLLKY